MVNSGRPSGEGRPIPQSIMPSTLGSAELKFAKKGVAFNTTAEQEVKLSVRERNLYRKLFLAVVPNGGTFSSYFWTGKVEFRLKGNAVETWQLGFAADAQAGPKEFSETAAGVVLSPPYWIETFTAAGAEWPVVSPGTDEQLAVVYDTNTATTKFHVHMKPLRFTGHFDEVAFIVSQSGTIVTGEANSYLILGCLSEPFPD